MERMLSLLLALTMAFALAEPAAAESASGTTLRLSDMTGSVTVRDSSGKEKSARADMRLYNGCTVETGDGASAFITLDDVKAVMLDASGKVEVRKSGKQLELYLSAGQLVFLVDRPLAADESLNIVTATMVTGVRGSFGWVSEDVVGLLHGHINVSVADGNGVQTVPLSGGTLLRAPEPGDEPKSEEMTEDDVPAAAVELLEESEKLQQQIADDVPALNVSKLIDSLPEKRETEAAAAQNAQSALAQGEREQQERIAQNDAAEAASGNANEIPFAKQTSETSQPSANQNGAAQSGADEEERERLREERRREREEEEERLRQEEENNAYAVVTFQPNGGVGSMTELTALRGVPAALPGNTFTRDGYIFTGWNTMPDGSGAAYANGAEAVLDGSMTLFAQWKKNGGSGTAENPGFTDASLTLDTYYAVLTPRLHNPEGVKERYGFRFTNADASLSSIVYKDSGIALDDLDAGEYTNFEVFLIEGTEETKVYRGTLATPITFVDGDELVPLESAGLTADGAALITRHPSSDEKQGSYCYCVEGAKADVHYCMDVGKYVWLFFDGCHYADEEITSCTLSGSSFEYLDDNGGRYVVTAYKGKRPCAISVSDEKIMPVIKDLTVEPETGGTALCATAALSWPGWLFCAAVVHGEDYIGINGYDTSGGRTLAQALDALRTDAETDASLAEQLAALKSKIVSASGAAGSGMAAVDAANVRKSAVIRDLTPETAYDLFFVARDKFGGYSDICVRENCVTAQSAAQEKEYKWESGTGTVVTLNPDAAVITVSGTGAMADYDCDNTPAPWTGQTGSATRITVGNGVTRIGTDAFHACETITEAELADSVAEIGPGAFSGCTALETVTIPANASIGFSAFRRCTALTDVVYGGTKTQWAEKLAGLSEDNDALKTADVRCSDGVYAAPALFALTLPSSDAYTVELDGDYQTSEQNGVTTVSAAEGSKVCFGVTPTASGGPFTFGPEAVKLGDAQLSVKKTTKQDTKENYTDWYEVTVTADAAVTVEGAGALYTVIADRNGSSLTGASGNVAVISPYDSGAFPTDSCSGMVGAANLYVKPGASGKTQWSISSAGASSGYSNGGYTARLQFGGAAGAAPLTIRIDPNCAVSFDGYAAFTGATIVNYGKFYANDRVDLIGSTFLNGGTFVVNGSLRTTKTVSLYMDEASSINNKANSTIEIHGEGGSLNDAAAAMMLGTLTNDGVLTNNGRIIGSVTAEANGRGHVYTIAESAGALDFSTSDYIAYLASNDTYAGRLTIGANQDLVILDGASLAVGNAAAPGTVDCAGSIVICMGGALGLNGTFTLAGGTDSSSGAPTAAGGDFHVIGNFTLEEGSYFRNAGKVSVNFSGKFFNLGTFYQYGTSDSIWGVSGAEQDTNQELFDLNSGLAERGVVLDNSNNTSGQFTIGDNGKVYYFETV